MPMGVLTTTWLYILVKRFETCNCWIELTVSPLNYRHGFLRVCQILKHIGFCFSVVGLREIYTVLAEVL